MEHDANWQRLLTIARRISQEYPDTVFIGGVAVAQYFTRYNRILTNANPYSVS
jgi:hypothetical protein